MTVAKCLAMAGHARIRTIRGLAPSADEISDDEILEIDGEMPPASGVARSPIVAPPTNRTRYVPNTRYSLIVPRPGRRTLRLVADEG